MLVVRSHAPSKHLYSYADAGHATAFEHADDLRRILTAHRRTAWR
jgi:hypothetical protein